MESVDDFDVDTDSDNWDDSESGSRANERVGTIVNSRFYIETDIDDGLTGLCRRGMLNCWWLQIRLHHQIEHFINIFANVFLDLLGIDLVTNERIAVKFAKKGREYALEDEYQNYLRMGADSKFLPFCAYQPKENIKNWEIVQFLEPEILEQGIPHIKYYGKFGTDTILVMTLCGPSLYELRLRAKYTVYPIKTTLLVGIQAVSHVRS